MNILKNHLRPPFPHLKQILCKNIVDSKLVIVIVIFFYNNFFDEGKEGGGE